MLARAQKYPADVAIKSMTKELLLGPVLMAPRPVPCRQVLTLLFFALSGCIASQSTPLRTDQLLSFQEKAAIDDSSGGLAKSNSQILEHITSASSTGGSTEKELQLRAEGNGALKHDRALRFDGKVSSTAVPL